VSDYKRMLERVGQKELNRRRLLKGAGGIGLGAAAGAFPRGLRLRGARAQEGGEVIVGMSQETINYNPLLYANTGIDTVPEVLMFDSLLKILPDGTFAPNLAAEVPTVENGGISPDGLTWTFKLRQGVTWHDGEPFTSRDVRFTWETVMNPDVAVRSRAGHDKIESLDTPDDHTVIIKLKEPFAPFIHVWTSGVTGVIPHHILSKEADINIAPFNTQSPIGTGPFKFVEHVGGDHLTVERNPNYHLGPAKLDRVIVKVVPELPVLYTQFKTGEIDVIDYQGIVPDRWEEAQTLPDRVVVGSPSNFVEFIYFNNARPFFQDKRVKQALYHAIDVDTIIDVIYYGVPRRTNSYLSPDHWAYNPDLPTYPFDLDRANALLDEAGWVRGDDGIRVKDGVRLSFTNSTTAGATNREATQQYIQQTWKEIGVEMTINNMPAAVVWGEYTIQSQFDTLLVAWDNPIPSDPDPTSRLHSTLIPAESGAGANYVQFKNAEADALMEQGVTETDQEKRKEIYYKLQEILADELPWLPIFNWTDPFGYKSNLVGYQVNPYSATNLGNVYEWYWQE